jgi:hypothetical protein
MLFISLYKNRKSSNNILKPFSIALDSRNNILVHIITFHIALQKYQHIVPKEDEEMMMKMKRERKKMKKIWQRR